MDRALWIKAAVVDLPSFKANCRTLARGLHDAYWASDFDRGDELLAALVASRSFLHSDALLHTWAFHMTQCLLQKAQAAALLLDFRTACAISLVAQRALDDEEVRNPSHRWTSVRVMQDSVLATMQWLGGAACKNFLSSPEAVAGRWRHNVTYLLKWADAHPDLAIGRIDLFNEACLRTGISVIKACARYSPDAVPGLVDFHNQYFNCNLPHHPRQIAVHKPQSWPVWEIAIALEACDRMPSRQRLERMYDAYQESETVRLDSSEIEREGVAIERRIVLARVQANAESTRGLSVATS